jgi:hypothetical protein
MAFVVALAELDVSFLQAASKENITNSYQANPVNQPVSSRIEPTNQATFKSAAEAEAQALVVTNWLTMVRSQRMQPLPFFGKRAKAPPGARGNNGRNSALTGRSLQPWFRNSWQ